MRNAFLACAVVLYLTALVQADDWPQWRGVNRDATIDDPAIPDALPEGPLPRRWSVPVGPGYSGPTVANGRVYLTDRQGEASDVRERVLCFDASSGETIWQHEYPVNYSVSYAASGPRASVTIHDGKALAVGGMGMFHCLDALTGEVIWARDLADDYKARMPIWGITAAPLVYQDLVIQVAGGDDGACVVALDLESGQQRWTALDQRAGYSAPVLIRQGDQDVVVCWTGESISGINPLSGEVFWTIDMLPRNMPIGVPTPVIADDKIFVSSFYDGSMLIRFDPNKPAAEKLWHRVGVDEKNTDALHCMIGNPIIKKDAIYGFDSYGELRCLDLETGDRIWEDDTAVPRERWATVHTIQNGDDEILLNERGELILATFSRNGFQEHSRSFLIEPTRQQLRRRGGLGVVWSHPAIADGIIYARSDDELIAASLVL